MKFFRTGTRAPLFQPLNQAGRFGQGFGLEAGAVGVLPFRLEPAGWSTLSVANGLMVDAAHQTRPVSQRIVDVIRGKPPELFA
ncbi:hypothetical protein [Hymenobacter sp. BT491]|uniref:hypothetical protein n=1 Tax=Hymenobacter sp. BT491 TaxID=2766779 RepID=UPI001653DF89|nr:hypothetical protein [Hymenobacter sp. BT491]MBC6989910.1 hypothetical protein [Hymenobacter sp. BT491]